MDSPSESLVEANTTRPADEQREGHAALGVQEGRCLAHGCRRMTAPLVGRGGHNAGDSSDDERTAADLHVPLQNPGRADNLSLLPHEDPPKSTWSPNWSDSGRLTNDRVSR